MVLTGKVAAVKRKLISAAFLLLFGPQVSQANAVVKEDKTASTENLRRCIVIASSDYFRASRNRGNMFGSTDRHPCTHILENSRLSPQETYKLGWDYASVFNVTNRSDCDSVNPYYTQGCVENVTRFNASNRKKNKKRK